MFDPLGGRKYLNDNERRAYLAAVRAETDEARRAFLETLFYTGCRISEGLNLLAGRVDILAKAVVFETLKRRRRGIFRLVPIPESLSVTLGAIASRKTPGCEDLGILPTDRIPDDQSQNARRQSGRWDGHAKGPAARPRSCLRLPKRSTSNNPAVAGPRSP